MHGLETMKTLNGREAWKRALKEAREMHDEYTEKLAIAALDGLKSAQHELDQLLEVQS